MSFLRFDNSINFKFNLYTRISPTAFSELCEIFGNKAEASKEIKWLFSGKYSFDTYVSNTGNETGEISIVIASDSAEKSNKAFLSPLSSSTVSLFALITDDGIFITKAARISAIIGTVSNRCIKCGITFFAEKPDFPCVFPDDVRDMAEQLAPIGITDSSPDVSVWEQHLEIMEKYAVASTCTLKYFSVCSSKNAFSKTFTVESGKISDIHINSSVMLVERCVQEHGEPVFYGDIFGTVTDFTEASLTVALDDAFLGDFEFPHTGLLHITKQGDIIQTKRLRRGLKRFSSGRALNPYLDLFIFDSQRARVPKYIPDLKEENLLSKNINPEQKRAVEGALCCEDIFLIQGPPGTGKTTAIAEICYQNALRGKKTLIASQTNLAVDNALSRLASNPKIRALRKGNEKTVQSEGIGYTEDNVISTWIKNTTEACEKNLRRYENIVTELEALETELEPVCSIHKKYREKLREKEDAATKNRILSKLLSVGEPTLAELKKCAAEFPDTLSPSTVSRILSLETGDFKCDTELSSLLTEKWADLSAYLEEIAGISTGLELAATAYTNISSCRESLDIAFRTTCPKYPQFKLEPKVLSKTEIMQAYASLCARTDELLKELPGGLSRMMNLYGKWNKKAITLYTLLIRTESDLKLTIPEMKAEKQKTLEKYGVDGKINDVYNILTQILSGYERYILDIKASFDKNEEFLNSLDSENEYVLIAAREFDKKIPERFARELPELVIEKEYIGEYYKGLFKNELYAARSLRTLTKKWIEGINSDNPEVFEQLKKIYINNANVIGITCNGSGSFEFEQDYPEFDMVIIDEVSKATPPELILPALKARSIVLVGDHKQLPPMIDGKTYDELSASLDSETAAQMKISLFESLYLSAPAELKVMLKTQYRMHSQIMNTVNQFYLDDGDGLSCGLDDSMHEHGVEGGFIKKDTHAMWVYTPLDERCDERRENTSFYNEYEILCIERILRQMNENLIRKGTSAKKEVGIITFYSEQTKRLYNRIFGKNYEYDRLDIRIGTVDKFQGIEKSVIICSFVRNNPFYDIGFAKDPRRINVALSRAKDLLIIVGCRDMFTKADERYDTVYKEIEKAGGDIDAMDIV